MNNNHWKEKLTKEEYRVLREKGTDAPWTGIYTDHFESGIYKCAGCDTPLFQSENKFKSGCGWPSFDDVLDSKNIILTEDNSHNMKRTEVICKNCQGHLGHVFPDGPKETTGQRYCINSTALNFVKKKS